MTDLDKLIQVFELMNKIPKHSEVTEDLREVREVHVQNLGKFFRQNIFYSQFSSLELQSLMSRNCFNRKGMLRMKNFYSNSIGKQLSERVKFQFQRFEAKELREESQSRFNAWKNQFWQQLRNNKDFDKSLIIVSNYFAYQELKLFFQEENSPVGFISEHTARNKIQSAFARFNSGDRNYLMVTERALYYDICEPKRYKNLIFYNLPLFSEVFDSLVNELESGNVFVFFSRVDLFELERIFGTKLSSEFVAPKHLKKFSLN